MHLHRPQDQLADCVWLCILRIKQDSLSINGFRFFIDLFPPPNPRSDDRTRIPTGACAVI